MDLGFEKKALHKLQGCDGWGAIQPTMGQWESMGRDRERRGCWRWRSLQVLERKLKDAMREADASDSDRFGEDCEEGKKGASLRR